LGGGFLTSNLQGQGAAAFGYSGYAQQGAMPHQGQASAFSQSGLGSAFSGALAGQFYGDPSTYPGNSASQAQNLALSAALNFGYQEAPGEARKMWDVWFDSKEGQKTVQRSPIVLDLNNNGKADITGKNITGDGNIDGPTTMFDLDPNSVSFEFKSQQRRPGSGAPAITGGYWVDPQGNKTDKAPPKGTQKNFNGYKYLDKSGSLVGEMKDGLYHYGKQEKREETEWLAKNGGDGLLVADFNKDGEINSAVELFGTVGLDGKERYKNGYQKLADLFDKNRDGKVSGDELKGLQMWVDANADGKVQEGELQSLKQHNLTSFDVANYDAKTMEGSYRVGGGSVAPYFDLSVAIAMAISRAGQVPSPGAGYFPSYPWATPYSFSR